MFRKLLLPQITVFGFILAGLAISPSQSAELRIARRIRIQAAQTAQNETLKRLDAIKLGSIHIASGPNAAIPDDMSKTLFRSAPKMPRNWTDTVYHWEPTEFAHQPLYFEQVPLERYGQSAHPALQPWISGAHFFGTFPLIPYKMGQDPPFRCMTTLGYYRPGSCAPSVRQRLTWSRSGGFWEGALWTAAVLALP